MAVSDAQKRANEKYRKANVKQVSVRFYPSESELWEHLQRQGNRSGYVKRLIAEDMARGDDEG